MRTKMQSFGKASVAMNLLFVLFLLTLTPCDTLKEKQNKSGSQSVADDHQHDFLMEGRNVEEVIVERILKEYPSTLSNSSYEFVNRYLDSMMVKFRSRVFNLYRKLTCGDGFCDPWNAELDLTRSDILNRQSSLKLTIKNIDLWHECPLPSSTSSYVILKKSLKTFIVTGSPAHPAVSLYEFRGDGQCQVIGSFNTAPNPCFAAFDSEEYPFLFVGHCRNSTKTEQHVNILLVTEGLERLQVIDVKNLQSMFTLNHLSNAYAFIITTDDEMTQNCYLYQWIDMFFENVAKFSTNLGKMVKTFSYGKESYLVSTNYAPLDNSPVTIWQFVPHRNSSWLKMYQVLNDCATKDAEPFTVGGLQFLAVACSTNSNKSESYLYWWTGSQFLLWQSIFTEAIVSWTAVKLTNDDTALIMHSYKNGAHTLKVFQLDDGYYWPNNARVQGLFPNRRDSEIQVENIQHMGMQLLTVIDNYVTTSKLISYRLQFEMDRQTTDAVSKYDELACINTISKEIRDEELKLQKIEKTLLELQTLKSKKVAAKKAKLMKESDKNAKCKDLALQLAKVETKIKEAERQSNQRAEFKVKNYDSLSVNRLTVHGSVEVPNVFVKSGTISGVDLADLQRTVVSKTRDQIFNASVIFQGGLNTLFLDVGSTLNGERIAGNLAINGGENVFTKPQHFHSLNVDHLALVNTVNQMRFKNLVLKSSRQTIHGKKTIKKLIARQRVLLQGGEINGVNVEAFFNRTLTVSGDQFISGPITFDGDVTVDGDIVCATINDINLNNLAKKVVTTNTPQIIRGKKQFMATMKVGNATLSGKLNNVAIPGDLLTRHTSQTIHHDIKIDGDVLVKNDLLVERTVNDVVLSQTLVTRCGNHTITGHKEFRNTVTAEDFRDEKPKNVWNYYGDLKVDHLETLEINGIHLKPLEHLMRKSRPQTFNGSLQCNSVIFNDVTIANLNGGKLDEKFVTTNTHQTIFTPLVIQKDAVFNKPVEMKEMATVNGLDISSLPKVCVMKTGDQTVRSYKVLHNIKTLSGIRIEQNDGKTTGIIPRLLKDKIDTVIVNGTLEIQKDLKCDVLNGHYLDRFISKIYYTDKSISLSSEKLFKHLIIKKNLYLNSYLNGVNVTDFFSKVVRLSTTEIITGNVKFLKPVKCYGPLSIKTLKDEILEKRIGKLVLVNDHNRITVPIAFQNGLEVDGNVIVALLNGRDVSNFISNVLLNSAYQKLGSMMIVGDVYIGNITVAGEINGLKPSDLILINQNANFDSITFKAPVTLSSLRVDAMVNLSNKTKVIPKFKVLKSKNVILQGTVNDVRPSDLPNMVLSKSGSQNFSISELVLKEDTLISHLTLKRPMINGIDLNDFRSRAVTTNTRQIITGKKTWEYGNLTMTEDIVLNGNVTTSTLSGVDINITRISKIEEQVNVALKGGVYYGDVYFKDKVNIKGLINGRPGLNDVILKTKNQTFNELKFGGDVEIKHLSVTGPVNGVDLEDLIENRITLKTNQIVKGNLTLHDVKINGSTLCKNEFSEYDYNEKIRAKHIWENVSFNCPVIVNGHIESHHPLNVELLNWPHLHDLTKGNLVARNKSNCFTALSKAVEGLAGIINYFEIATSVLSSHSAIHVQYKDHVYILLATSSISQRTCSNVKILRCDNKVANCHLTKGVLKVPKGFVKQMHAFEESGLTNVAFVMEEKRYHGLLPSNCPKPFDGVFIFKDVLEKTRAYFFIPASKITGIAALERGPTQLRILISSLTFGIRIYSLEKNFQPVVIADKEGTTVGCTTLHLPRNMLFLEINRKDSEVKLVVSEWINNNSMIKHNFEVSLQRSANKLVAFRIVNEKYIAISSDIIRIYNIRDSSIIKVQEILYTAKDLQKFEYLGRVYLLILDESNEMGLYRWTDLLRFSLETRVKFQHSVDEVYPFILEELFIMASSSSNLELKNWSTIIYKAINSGEGLKHYC